MIIFRYIFIFFVLGFLPYGLTSQENGFEKRAWAHLVLSDPREALREIEANLKTTSNPKPLHRAKISCYAHLQDESALFKSYNEYIKLYPEEELEAELLEELSWAIINKGISDSSPMVRFEAAVNAFYAQDAKGIPLLDALSYDPNVGIRTFAYYLFSNLHDEVFEQRALQAALSEQSSYVKLAAIDCLQGMQSKKAIPVLKKILETDDSTSEEKLAAVEALAEILPEIKREDLMMLVSSTHSYFRALACELVIKHLRTNDCDLLLPLIKDSSVDVQMFALFALGISAKKDILAQEGFIQELIKLTNDAPPKVAIASHWLLLVLGNTNQENSLESYLQHENRSIRLFAAAACAHAGSITTPLSKKWVSKSSDPLVRINLALHLIRQRQAVDLARKELQDALSQTKERLDWAQDGIFSLVAPCTTTHLAVIPRYPETKDLACRLDLYEAIATCGPVDTEVLRSFLKERTWGISAMAATLLMQEGDELAIDSIKKLLQEKAIELRLQAALLLSLATQDEEALTILQSSYPSASRELKEEILLGIGSIGAKTSLPFLKQKLFEPSPVLRLRAAGAVLKCLYH
jgi:HEAT repeat protein